MIHQQLYLLQYFSSVGIDLGKAIESWTGSKKTSQDYEFGSVSVEVKSSTAVDASRVNISNCRQLDDDSLDNLFLARVLFDVRQGDERTLPKLIDSIKVELEKKAPESKLDFEEKLVRAGYQPKHVEQYNNRMYSKRNLTFYKVENDFPRILESNLPVGITKVTYEISLDVCRDFIIDEDNALNAVRACCD